MKKDIESSFSQENRIDLLFEVSFPKSANRFRFVSVQLNDLGVYIWNFIVIATIIRTYILNEDCYMIGAEEQQESHHFDKLEL